MVSINPLLDQVAARTLSSFFLLDGRPDESLHSQEGSAKMLFPVARLPFFILMVFETPPK